MSVISRDREVYCEVQCNVKGRKSHEWKMPNEWKRYDTFINFLVNTQTGMMSGHNDVCEFTVGMCSYDKLSCEKECLAY